MTGPLTAGEPFSPRGRARTAADTPADGKPPRGAAAACAARSPRPASCAA